MSEGGQLAMVNETKNSDKVKSPKREESTIKSTVNWPWGLMDEEIILKAI